MHHMLQSTHKYIQKRVPKPIQYEEEQDIESERETGDADTNKERENVDFLANYRYVPPSKQALLYRLRDLGNSGSVEGIRKLIKNYEIVASPRELNKIVRIEGYKFITRCNRLLNIRDTQFNKQSMESGVSEEYFREFPSSTYKPSSISQNPRLLNENARLRKENAQLNAFFSHLLQNTNTQTASLEDY
jgi:hypothetical protein